MPSWLCKIWKVFANLLGKIIDLIMAVVKSLVDMAIDAINTLLSAAGGWLSSPVVWIAAGVGIWWLLGRGTKKKDDQKQGPRDSTRTIPAPRPGAQISISTYRDARGIA